MPLAWYFVGGHGAYHVCYDCREQESNLDSKMDIAFMSAADADKTDLSMCRLCQEHEEHPALRKCTDAPCILTCRG